MSARCDVCGRKPMYGHKVSHSNRKTNRRFMLNLQRRRLELNGEMRNVNVCTRCLRTMVKVDTKVAKAINAAATGKATGAPRPAAQPTSGPAAPANALPQTVAATTPAKAAPVVEQAPGESPVEVTPDEATAE